MVDIMKSPPSDAQAQGPTTLLRHLFIWISVGVIAKEEARRERPPRPLAAQYTMYGFIRSRLSFDFPDHHTCSALVAEPWLPIMHQS